MPSETRSFVAREAHISSQQHSMLLMMMLLMLRFLFVPSIAVLDLVRNQLTE